MPALCCLASVKAWSADSENQTVLGTNFRNSLKFIVADLQHVCLCSPSSQSDAASDAGDDLDNPSQPVQATEAKPKEEVSMLTVAASGGSDGMDAEVINGEFT